MGKGYWIAHVTVWEPDRYKDYVAISTANAARHGGKFLVRGGKSDEPERPFHPRHVVIEFPDLETARRAYDDPDYQRAVKIRHEAADSVITIVEGFEQ